MKTWIKIFLVGIAAFSFIGCDRVTKDLAKEHLIDGESISYFHDTFRLVYVENTGAFLSLGNTLPKHVSFWLLGVLPLAFLLLLFFYTIKKSREMDFWKMFSLTMIFSGGIGNIIDRLLFDRHVTDFMNLGFHNLRTGIFNFADVYITIGALVFLLFFSRNKDSKSYQGVNFID